MQKIGIRIFSFLLIFFLASLFFFTFLRKETLDYQVHTIIEDKKEYVISITFPKTNISKIDNQIHNFIQKEISSFQKSNTEVSYLLERNELNIDFDYYIFNNRYINIAIKKDIYDGKQKKNNYSIYTYIYDLKEKEFYDIWDMFDDKENVLDIIKKEFLIQKAITVSDMNLISMIIYNDQLLVYTVDDSILSISIPLTSLGFQFPTFTTSQKEEILVSKTASIIDPTKPVVAITFDDGPSEYTSKIIDTLKNNDANATFFVLGNKVEAYQEVIRKSIENGNEIGNHTYNHKWLSRLSKDEIISQIDKTQTILQETVGYTPTHLRPTYGSVNQRIRDNTSLTITLWTIDTKDWKIKNVDRIVEKAVKNIEDGDIILMHDIFERSSKALEKIILILKEQGYQFVTISELEEVKLIRSRLQY